MKKIIKLLVVLTFTLSLFACSSNNKLANKALPHDGNDFMYDLSIENSTVYDFSNKEDAITDVPRFLRSYIKANVRTSHTVVVCYEIEDDSVKDDEILVDFYGYHNDGSGKISYYYLEDGYKGEVTVECPVTNVVLNREGKYYVASTARYLGAFTNINLEFGKHYVFNYAPLSFMVDTYYDY